MARTPDGRRVFLARSSQILIWDSSRPDQFRSAPLPKLARNSGPERGHDRDHDRQERPLPGPPESGPGDRRRPELSGFDRDGRQGRGSVSWHAMAASPDGTRLYLIERDPTNRVHVLALDGDEARWVDWPN